MIAIHKWQKETKSVLKFQLSFKHFVENVDIDCCNGEYKLSRWQQEECGIEFGRFPAYKKEKQI